jgi:hypothetical protein
VADEGHPTFRLSSSTICNVIEGILMPERLFLHKTLIRFTNILSDSILCRKKSPSRFNGVHLNNNYALSVVHRCFKIKITQYNQPLCIVSSG